MPMHDGEPFTAPGPPLSASSSWTTSPESSAEAAATHNAAHTATSQKLAC